MARSSPRLNYYALLAIGLIMINNNFNARTAAIRVSLASIGFGRSDDAGGWNEVSEPDVAISKDINRCWSRGRTRDSCTHQDQLGVRDYFVPRPIRQLSLYGARLLISAWS